MEESKELAKAADMVEQHDNEPFDNAVPWLSSEDSEKAPEEPTAMCSNSASQDLITRITDEPIDGEELLSETKENWWATIDGIDWLWLFPTANRISNSPVYATIENVSENRIKFDNCVAEPTLPSADPDGCDDGDNDDDQDLITRISDELIEGEELLPAVEGSLWVDIDGVIWNWLDPNLNSDSDNDNTQVHDAQMVDDAPPHITFDNCVEVAQVTFQELNDEYHGDMRSPSEITPTQEVDPEDSWMWLDWSGGQISEDDGLHTMHSISTSEGSMKVNKSASCSNAQKNSLAKPDLLTMVKDLAAKLRDLANDINALVGRLAVDAPSDAWIDSNFSTTRSIDGSLDCKPSLGSDASNISTAESAPKCHEKVCRRCFCDDSDH